MSFYTGTQCELLYAMPASGPAVTAAAATVMSGTTAANPAYALPLGFFNQQSGSGAGRSLIVEGGGWLSVGSTAVTTIFQVGLNSTVGTGNPAIVLGKTGTMTTLASQTNVGFMFKVLVTCTSPGQAGTASALNAIGKFELGAANNAATGTWGTTAATSIAQIYGYMIGTPQTAIAPIPTTQYYVECSNTWSVTTGAPTITLTNYFVWGLN